MSGIWYLQNGAWGQYVGAHFRTALQDLLSNPTVSTIRVFGPDGQYVDFPGA